MWNNMSVGVSVFLLISTGYQFLSAAPAPTLHYYFPFIYTQNPMRIKLHLTRIKKQREDRVALNCDPRMFKHIEATNY